MSADPGARQHVVGLAAAERAAINLATGGGQARLTRLARQHYGGAVITGREAVFEAMLRRGEVAREISVMLPESPEPETIKTDTDVLLAAIRRGVCVRQLVHPANLASPAMQEQDRLLTAAGSPMRLRVDLPENVVMFDRRTAFIPLRASSGDVAVVLSGEAACRPTVHLFENLWRGSSRAAQPQLSEAHLDVLRALNSGLTDEAAARQLGISERSVRRHMATVMQELGVTSRLAAGAQAARMGLL